MGKLFTGFKEMGNPLDEESADLLVLDTKYIADLANSRLVAIHHSKGEDQFQSLIEGLKKEEQTKNKITFFKEKEISRATWRGRHWRRTVTYVPISSFNVKEESVISMNSSSTKTSQLQLPSVIVENFTHAKKSQLVGILESKTLMPNTEQLADAIIIDESALVNSQLPCTSKTFDDYANEDILLELDLFLPITKSWHCAWCV